MTKPVLTLRIPTVISSFGTIKGTKSHHLRQHLILTNRVRPRRHPTWHEVVTGSLLFDFEDVVFFRCNSLINLCIIWKSMWTNKIFLITTWWILDFSSLPVMLWTSWIFKRFWIWKPWFGAVEEKVDLLAEQEQAPVVTHPFCSLKITESWEKRSHPVILPTLGNPYVRVRVDNKNYSHLRSWSAFVWLVWTYFDIVSHWQRKKLFHHMPHVMIWRKCTYTYYSQQKSQKSWTVLNPGYSARAEKQHQSTATFPNNWSKLPTKTRPVS